MLREIQEIQALATKYSKSDLGRMVQLGLLDPQKAMMAGMMIQRIEQQNAKPPQATVAQDVLGLPAVPNQPPQQPQQAPQAARPQMPPQGVAALPAQAAPNAGIEALPTGDVGNYAGGGIVAFAEGGDIDRDEHGVPRFQGGGAFMFPEESLFGKFQRGSIFSEATPGSLLGILQKRYRDDPEVQKQIEEERLKQAQTAENASELQRIQNRAQAARAPATSKIDTTSNLLAGKGAPSAPPVAGEPRAPRVTREPAAPAAPAAPALPEIARPEIDKSTFEEKVARGTPKLPDLPKTEVKAPGKLLEEQTELYKQAGYDPDVFKNMIKGIEEKKGKAASEKDAALGMGIMKAGIKLLGSREGQEFQALSEGAQEGLNDYAKAVERLKDRQEKYDERVEQLRLADAQAKRTGAESALARRDKLAEMLQNDERALFTAKAQAANTGVQTATSLTTSDKSLLGSMYAADKSAQTQLAATEMTTKNQLKIAQLNAQTQREYTAALKAQGLADSQIKNIMGTAAEIYKAAITKNPMADETAVWNAALQQASQGYAQVAPMLGRSVPPGAMPPPARLSPADYEKKYGLPPIK